MTLLVKGCPLLLLATAATLAILAIFSTRLVSPLASSRHTSASRVEISRMLMMVSFRNLEPYNTRIRLMRMLPVTLYPRSCSIFLRLSQNITVTIPLHTLRTIHTLRMQSRRSF
ncbi:uncharacterized protein BDZ99DRAFT_96097 [Mytilinidion resinicola]|uniref:Uncharacterized protein n=1 Tax=Mytilinidion resinicola TaxID=574789 RepID=A0A6A6YCF5_9PEZI|nr:uncharacterized protein BDZ99DRAFT_96097 [Mytilinidion resinicola]KAF2806492.1 hypothetical protein BDZ99DRAFT_96097 [Mytilinidion resinicola]